MNEKQDKPGVNYDQIWAMGITGTWKTVTNVAAITLVCALFYMLVMNLSQDVKEERELFRQEMKLAREANTKEWEAIHENERSVRALSDSVQKNRVMVLEVMEQVRETQRSMLEVAALLKEGRKDTISLSNSVRELTKQIDRMKAAEKKGAGIP